MFNFTTNLYFGNILFYILCNNEFYIKDYSMDYN